jgi:CRP-like cAMP-binding protein
VDKLQVKKRFGSKTHQFKKGQLLYFLGEVPRHSFYITDGYVKVYAVADDGSEQIVRFAGPGEFLALGFLFEYSSVLRFYYQALTDCSTEIITPESFQKHTQDSQLLRVIVDQLNMVSNSGLVRNMALQQIKARHKIVYFLYYMSLRFGKNIGDSLVALKIPLTHQVIAENLGLTRETVSMEMSKLKKESLIMVRTKHYIIDTKAATNLVGRELNLDK